MQDGGLQVMDADFVFCDAVSKFVTGARDQPAVEVVVPQSIDDDPRRQRVVFVGNLLCQYKSTALLGVVSDRLTAKHLQKSTADDWSSTLWIALLLNVRIASVSFAHSERGREIRERPGTCRSPSRISPSSRHATSRLYPGMLMGIV